MAAQPARQVDGNCCAVHVGNLPYKTDEDAIKEIFNRAGEVTAVRIVTDKKTRKQKGYAFVDFADSSSVQAALEMFAGYDFNGRKLRIDVADRLSRLQGDRKPTKGERKDDQRARRDHFVETFVADLSNSETLFTAFFDASSEKEAKLAIRTGYGSEASSFIDNPKLWVSAMESVAEQTEEIKERWAILRAGTQKTAEELPQDMDKASFLLLPRGEKRKFLENNPEFDPGQGKWKPGKDRSNLGKRHSRHGPSGIASW